MGWGRGEERTGRGADGERIRGKGLMGGRVLGAEESWRGEGGEGVDGVCGWGGWSDKRGSEDGRREEMTKGKGKMGTGKIM